MNRVAALLLLCSVAASAAVLNAVPDGKLMQQHVPRSQEAVDLTEQDPEESTVLPLPEPAEGLAFVENELVPPDGYGTIIGPGRHYCREDGPLFDSTSGNESDCVAGCNASAECQYVSFWREGSGANRCVLTRTCINLRWSSGNVVIFEKLPRALTVPEGYNLTHAPSKNYCADRSYWQGSSTSVEDCATKCNERITCQYFSYWRTHSNHQCRLTLFCRSLRQQSHSIAIFAKPPAVAPPAPEGYNLTRGPGRDWCADHPSYNGASTGLEDCAAKCNNKVECQYFSYWQTHSHKWCRLTLFCRRFRQHDEKIVIYEKPAPVPPPVPAGMNLSFHMGPGRDYCNDHATYNGVSQGFEDCAARCNNSADCGYFSYWETHSRKWCRITLFCDNLRQQDHTIFIYKKPVPVAPAPPAGFTLKHGTSRNLCKLDRRWNGRSAGVADCATKCNNRWDCEFFSIWLTGGYNWCLLSGTCANYSQQGHHIVIYDKDPVTAPESPGNYTLFRGPGRDYCYERYFYSGRSAGVEDCAAKCDQRVDCQYFTFWITGGHNWCRLFLFCRNFRQYNEHLVIYAKPAPVAPEPVANFSLAMGPGRDYCADGAVFDSRSEGYEDCAEKCTQRGPDCMFMTFWRTSSYNRCRLTRFCDNVRQTDDSLVIYEKAALVTPEAPLGYNLTHNLSKNYCQDSYRWHGSSRGIEDCANKCDDRWDCEFFSFWVSGGSNWCRLSGSCNTLAQQEHWIAIYDKLPPTPPDAPEGYELTHGPSRDYCYPDRRIWSGRSAGSADCAAKCDARQNCVYMVFWLTGGANWCSLYTTCTGYRQQNHHIVIYKKGSPPAPEGYEVIEGIGKKYCADVSNSYRGSATNIEDCASRCNGRPECHYFTYWLSGTSTNCVLSGSCARFAEQNNPIVIFEKTLTYNDTSPAGYNLVEDEGTQFCGKVRNNVWQGYGELSTCSDACGAEPKCKFFTHSQQYAYCILSSGCDLKLKASVDMGYKIYEKAD